LPAYPDEQFVIGSQFRLSMHCFELSGISFAHENSHRFPRFDSEDARRSFFVGTIGAAGSRTMTNLEDTEIPVADADLDLPPVDTVTLKASRTVQIVTLIAITVPFLGVVAAPFAVWGWGFGWSDLGLLVGMYIVTAFGITVGFHRLFTHRSFETPNWIKFLLGVSGSMALQGSIIQWVGMHRRHHQHSDLKGDPHSPVHHGSGVLGTIKGFFHAHMGWFFDADPADLNRYVKDLKASRSTRICSNLFPLWVALSFIIPAVIGGLVTMSWVGALTGFIWGGLVRMFLVHHVTWSVNSACHLWGFRPFRTNDQSRNNPVFGILAMGEGWHNTHHAFPQSVRHGLRWWEFDSSYVFVKTLSWMGLAWNLKLPSQEVQDKQRRKA